MVSFISCPTHLFSNQLPLLKRPFTQQIPSIKNWKEIKHAKIRQSDSEVYLFTPP
jgi:hypothetical protein